MNRRVSICRASSFVITALFSFLTSAANLRADSIAASGDAHVNSALPSLNFGSMPFLQTDGTTRTYVKFDLSSFPGMLTGSAVVKGNLVLRVGPVGSPGSIQVSE
jgi:hypothetical protein